MIDVASASTGAVVSIATSNDENHPASNIIDGDESTFWMTTGLYPQAFVISFPSMIEFRAVQLQSSGVKYVVVEKSTQNHPIDFEPIAEKALHNEIRKLQTFDVTVNKTSNARHIKVTLLAGHESFASVHQLKVDGKATR